MARRVLAIGATGFIGRYVLPLLVDQGHEVAVLHRGHTVPGLPEGIRVIRGDRDHLAGCRGDLERFGPDVILDLILYTERQAREVVSTIRGTAGRLVTVSSADVYRNYDGFRGLATAPPDPVPLSEDAPLRESRYPYRGHNVPHFPYAHDYEKILVEQVVSGDPSLPATVLRLPAVYGPGDRQHRLRPYLQCIWGDGDPILLEVAEARWRWTRGYVENVAAAIAFTISDDRCAGHVYNIGDEPTLTELEWAQEIVRVAGGGADGIAVARPDLPEGRRKAVDWRYDLWTDTTALRSHLEFVRPIPLDEALRRTVEWELSHRDLL